MIYRGHSVRWSQMLLEKPLQTKYFHWICWRLRHITETMQNRKSVLDGKTERKLCKENTDSELDNERSTGEDEKESMTPVFYRNRLPNGTPDTSKMWHTPPDLPGHDARFLILVCHRWWTIHFTTFHHTHIFYRSQGDDEMSTAHHSGYRLGNNKSMHTWNIHRTDV